MKTIFIDKSTKRKKEIVKNNLTTIDEYPVFSIVEFNIIASCNRACSFCPVSDPNFYKNIDAKGLLKIDFYKKVLTDLKQINYKGKILYSGFSEPLLHPKIEQIISLTKEYLPESTIEMISNGDKLNVQKLEAIFKNGLDIPSISMYDGSHQVELFNRMIMETDVVAREKVILRRRYYEDGNYGLTISNRAGLVDSNEYRDDNEDTIFELPLRQACHYPFYMVKIDFNGDMLLCSHDWQKKFIIGNLNDSSIWELWISKKLNDLKNKLSNKDRNMDPCKDCDVHGNIIGKDSLDLWKKTREK